LDLCVVLAVGVLLLGVVIPSLRLVWGEQSNRIKCASNLRNLATHGFIYANSDTRAGQKFPRTYFDPGAPLDQTLRGGKSNASTSKSFDAGNPPGPVGVNNVMASFFLLLKATDLTTDVFICPSSEISNRAYMGEDPQQFANWPSAYPEFVSYSYNCPFPTEGAVRRGWKFDVTLGPDSPFAADINPGDRNGNGPTKVMLSEDAKATRPGNSPNHWFDGQSIAYCDGHVEWKTTPFAGATLTRNGPADNIYTAGTTPGSSGGMIWTNPTAATDSVMLPTAQDAPGSAAIATRTPDMSGPMKESTILATVVGGVVLLIVVGIVLWLVLRKKKPQMQPYLVPPGMMPPGGYPPGAYPPGGYAPPGYPQGYPPPGAYPPPPQGGGYPPQPGQNPNWPPRQ
jgi:hypothetical protein